MKMTTHPKLGSAGAVILLVTSSFAQQVRTDYDRDADFRQYKTYSWAHVQTQDELLVDRIKAAVNADSTAKGFLQLESGGDIPVMAMETTQTQQTLNTFYDSFGGGWRWRGIGDFGESTTSTENYKVGTLVVDLLDARTKAGSKTRGMKIMRTVPDQFAEIFTVVGAKPSHGFVRDNPDGNTDASEQGEIDRIRIRNDEVAALTASAQAHLTGSLAFCGENSDLGNLHLVNG